MAKAMKAVKAMKDIDVRLYIGGKTFEVKKSKDFKEVLEEATGSIWNLAYVVAMDCPVYRLGNQDAWENVACATTVYLDGVGGY